MEPYMNTLFDSIHKQVVEAEVSLSCYNGRDQEMFDHNLL